MMKSNSLTNRILALALTLVMILGMLPSGFTSADAVSAELMVYIDPLDEWIEKGYTLKVWSGSDARLPTDDNGDGIYNFQLPSGWTAFELRVSDEESGYDYIYYTNNMEIPTDDRNLYTAESVEMVTDLLGEITGTWSVYTPQSYTTVYFKPLQEWIDAGYLFNFSETPDAEFHFFTDSDGDGIYEVSLDSELVEQWRDGRNLHIQVREAGEDGWFSYKYYRQNVMPNDGSNLFTATALDEEYQNEIIGTWSVYTPGAVEPEEPETPEVTYVAEVNGTKFETLAEAVAAAESGATVTLLGNASGAGVVINKDITIDFGGFTYTFTEGVGSTGTESNGFQILSGNTVTLKNGTLNVAEADKREFYMLIQNYANLTVTDMTLDGTNLDKYSGSDGDSYTLSNNSGTVTINGNTNINANDEGDLAYAFDVCRYGSYAVPTVTVNTTGEITGNIQVSEGLEENLTITGGTYNTDVSAYVPMGWQQDENGAVIVDSVIDTEAELVAAIAKGGEVTLGANITLSGPITIDKNVTLNLNGYKLTLPDHSNYAVVVKDSLTINGNGYVQVNGNYGIGLSTSCTGGLTVNGGVFTGAGNCDYMIGAYNGKVTINGGEFTTPYCVVNSFDGYNAIVEINGGKLSADYPVLGTNVTVSDAATLDIDEFLCVIGNTYYHTLEAAVTAVQQGETITMLADTKASFNVGNATGSKSQNFTLDLNGYTLTLGPGVGSSGTSTNGLRVMAYSALTIRNGNVVCSSEAEDKIKMGIANYGTLVLDDVNLTAGALTQYTINNRGKLTLSGKTTVTNGSVVAITNDPYNKYYTENVNAELICDSADVTVGDVLVERYARNSNNQGSVVLSISAGQFGSITEDGETSIAVEGNISGGSYANDVSAYCVDGKTAELIDGKYEVRLEQNFGFDKAEHTVDYEEGLIIEANDNKLIAQGSNAVVYSIAAAEGSKAENASIDAATGKVTVSGVGTFVITAKQEDDDTYASAEASYTLTVNKGASSITLKDGTAVNLTFGKTSYQMPIEKVGDGEITYAITKNDDGLDVGIDKVSGVISISNTTDQMGTFTVTVTMAEGDNYNATSAVYTVTLDYAETPTVPFTLSAEANDKGWYEVETLLLKPADGYQICLKENITKEDGWVDNNIAFDNGVYDNVTVYLKDAQGNITEPVVVGTLQVDNVDPTAGIEIVNDVLHTIVEKIFFVTNEDITIKITAGDATSGIESVQLSRDSGESFDDLGAVSEAKIVLSAEYRDFIQIKVIDKAGREYILNSEYTFVVDAKNPTIDSAFVGTDAESEDKDGKTVYFDNGVDFSVKYTVDENNLDLHDKNLNVTINNEAQTGWTLSDAGVVEKPLTGEGVYEITAVFTDVANNEPAEITDTYVIDTEAPTITLNPGETTIVNGVHYTAASGYGVGITINEALYDVYLEHGVKPVVTVKRNGQSYNYGALDWSANTATLKLSDNGVYEITVGYDNLVHENVSETITVCVDHEVPEITLTHGINLEVNGVFYTKDENYGLKISLNEDLYDHYYNEGNGFKPVVTVNGDAADLDWSKPEATLTLAKNGVYEVVVTYENHLHKAETQKITICVDHEAPVITLTSDIDLVKNDVYYTSAENYGLKISLNEDLYDHYYNEGNGFKPVVTVNGDTADLDWSKPEATLTLAENGVYEVIVTYENHPYVAETQKITICVDHEEPVITLTPDIDLFVNNVYYTSTENYGLKISLNEDLYAHYLNCGIKPVVTVNGDAVDLNWDVPETILTLAENGVYEVVVSYENYLHKAEEKTITICVDHEIPTIELDPGAAIFIEAKNVYHTNANNYGLKITLTEDLYDHYLSCGIEPVVVVEMDGKVVDLGKLEWSKAKDDSSKLEATQILAAEGNYVVAVSYDNIRHDAVTQQIAVCVDRTLPEVEITYEGIDNPTVRPNRVDEKTGNVAVFGQAVTAVITVNEVNFDKATVTVNGTAAEYTADKWTTDGDVHTLRIPLQSDDNYTIEVTAVDYATNANETLKHLGEDVTYAMADVDTTDPSDLHITYEQSVWEGFLNQITFGRFFGDQTKVTVHATDEISGIEQFAFEYILAPNVGAPNAGSEAPIIVKAKDVEFTYDQENGVYAYRFSIPTEALTNATQFHGSLKFVATDWAGNAASFDTLGMEVEGREDAVDYNVIVDNIAPAGNFNISNPVNQTDNVAYYNGNIVLNINIHEANFFAQDVQIAVTKDGAAYNGYTLAGWYGGSNTLTLTEDGDYQISINYRDRSGNNMPGYFSGNLTLDTVAPVISVTNIEQNSANKDEVYGFVITVTDINLDAETVKPVLNAVVQGEDGLYSTKQIDLGAAQVTDNGDTVTFTVENLDADALYTLTCSAEDMSDNVSTAIVLEDGEAYETVNFSINRNGSTYGFGSDYMTDLVSQYYVYSVYEDVVIVEVNVDPIENYTVTVNGTELVEGTDYTTEQSSNDGEWSKRTYVVKKELFAAEGEYNVIVSSVDKTETTAYSDIKDLVIAFVVDQTAPVLNISGLQTGGRYQTDEQTVTMIPTDEGGRLNSLKVVVMDSDGEPLTDENGNDISVRFDYSGDELLDYLAQNGDMVSFTVPTGLEHTVQIICNDCAVNAEGLTNETNETYERVTVSQNALVIFYANKPAFYGTIGAVAALVILIIVLLKKKKNDKK